MKATDRLPPPPSAAIPTNDPGFTLLGDITKIWKSEDAAELLDWHYKVDAYTTLHAHQAIINLENKAVEYTKQTVERIYDNIISLASLLASGDDSDCTIAVGKDDDTKRSVHRFVLAARSPYHHSLLLSGFSAASGDLQLPSELFTKESMDALLTYLYTDHIDPNVPLKVIRELWAGADFLSCTHAMAKCENEVYERLHMFRCSCSSCVKSLRNMLVFGETYGIASIRAGVLHVYYEAWYKAWVLPDPFKGLEASMVTDMATIITKRIAPENAVTVYIHATDVLRKVNQRTDPDGRVEKIVEDVQSRAHYIIVSKFAKVCASKPFKELLADWNTRDVLEGILKLITEGLRDDNAVEAWEEFTIGQLSFHGGVPQVQTARTQVIAFLQRRWKGIAAMNGFEHLYDELAQMLADDINVNKKELCFNPLSKTGRTSGMKKMLNARQTPIPPPVEVVQERSVHTQVLQVNDRVVLQDGRRGIVKYIGLVSFAPGQWAGVRLLLPTGRNDGSVDGRRYFTCDPNYGCFVRLATLHQ